MKIQHLSAERISFPVRLACLCCAALLALPACGGDASGDDPVDAAAVADRDRFGDPYQIVTNFHSAEPDFMPQFRQDTLVARVTYPGGCDDHDFDLRHDVEGDTAKLWLLHDANGDDCESLVRDELTLNPPGEALSAPVVVLLNPQGGDPFIVKWGR